MNVFLIGLVVYAWGFSSSFAQEGNEFELPRLKVEAKKNIPTYSFAQFLKFDVSESSPISIDSTLRNVPGVHLVQDGGPGGRTTLFIRGAESRHTLFVLDGLKLNDPSNTDRQFDAAFFSSNFLRDIQLHKGPQAVLYGSDAMGGVVELTSRKGESAPETRWQIMGGSFGTAGFSLGQDWQKHLSHRGTFTVSSWRTDGISRASRRRFEAKERDGAEVLHLTNSSQHIWSEKLTTDLLLTMNRGRNELDGATGDTDDRSQNDQYVFQQKTTGRINENVALALKSGLNRHQRAVKTETAGDNHFTGHSWQQELWLENRMGSYDWLMGLVGEDEDFNQSQVERTAGLYSAVVQGSRSIGKLKLQLGLRGERHSRFGDFGTGSGGVSWKQNQQRWFAQVSRGYKAPTLYQLYAPPLGGLKIGNTSLQPETNLYTELGWEQNWGFLDVSIAIFQNELKNLITYSSGAGYLNQGHFTALGGETKLNMRQDSSRLGFAYNYQEFNAQNTPVLRRPSHQWLTDFEVMPNENYSALIRSRILSSRQDLETSGKVVRLAPYTLFDLDLKRSWQNREVILKLINITNRDYEDLYGFSTQPRSFMLQFAGRFN